MRLALDYFIMCDRRVDVRLMFLIHLRKKCSNIVHAMNPTVCSNRDLDAILCTYVATNG